MIAKKTVSLAVLVILLLAGCIGTNDVSNLVQQLPEVQTFLAQNPNANIQVIYLDQASVQTKMPTIQEKCGSALPIQPYYFVTVKQNNDTIEVWLTESKQVQCLVRTNNGAQVPAGTQQSQTATQGSDQQPAGSETPITDTTAQNTNQNNLTVDGCLLGGSNKTATLEVSLVGDGNNTPTQVNGIQLLLMESNGNFSYCKFSKWKSHIYN